MALVAHNVSESKAKASAIGYWDDLSTPKPQAGTVGETNINRFEQEIEKTTSIVPFRAVRDDGDPVLSTGPKVSGKVDEGTRFADCLWSLDVEPFCFATCQQCVNALHGFQWCQQSIQSGDNAIRKDTPSYSLLVPGTGG